MANNMLAVAYVSQQWLVGFTFRVGMIASAAKPSASTNGLGKLMPNNVVSNVDMGPSSAGWL